VFILNIIVATVSPSEESLWNRCVRGLGFQCFAEIHRKVGEKVVRKARGR